MSGGFNVEGSVPGVPVSGMDPNGNIWSTGTVSCVSVQAGTTGQSQVTGIQTYTASGGDNTAALAAGTTLSTLAIAISAASGTQVPDTTRDYMCYCTTTGGGTNNTLTIGPNTTATAATILAAATLGTGVPFSFLLPAGWFIRYAGTAALGVQNGLPV